MKVPFLLQKVSMRESGMGSASRIARSAAAAGEGGLSVHNRIGMTQHCFRASVCAFACRCCRCLSNAPALRGRRHAVVLDLRFVLGAAFEIVICSSPSPKHPTTFLFVLVEEG